MTDMERKTFCAALSRFAARPRAGAMWRSAEMKDEFYSNCFIEMVKAKLRNPAVKVMYLPAFLNECYCPHWMWLDDDGEHDFYSKGRLPWWKWFWHKGRIRTVHRGCYKGCIDQMIDKKYYS